MGRPSHNMTEREAYDQMVGRFLTDHPEYLQEEGAVMQAYLEGDETPQLRLDDPTTKAFLRWGFTRDLIPPSHQPRVYALLSTTTEEEAEKLSIAHYRATHPEEFPEETSVWILHSSRRLSTPSGRWTTRPLKGSYG
jgi:hypothetical protein